MNPVLALSRSTTYLKRHGLRAAFGRAAQDAHRALFLNRMVLFYFDLASSRKGNPSVSTHGPEIIHVECKKTKADISPDDLQSIVNFWNPEIANKELHERFGHSATLWMIKVDGSVAGYGWTLQGRTIEPHFYTLAQGDVHLFDFYVAPAYRGRGLNPQLVNSILSSLTPEVTGRAFIEAAEWNVAQLSSLKKTPFQLLGYARKFRLAGRTFVRWYAARFGQPQPSKDALKRVSVVLLPKLSRTSVRSPKLND